MTRPKPEIATEMFALNQSGMSLDEIGKRYGVTWMAVARRLRRYGFPSLANRAPQCAYAAQKKHARSRGVGWELNFEQWWAIWQESGHWEHRGPGSQGYVMCRRGDIGPYAIGNVFIATGLENCSKTPAKLSSLPIGVYAASGKFQSRRMINGKRRYLGTHETPELAHAAYLSLGPIERSAINAYSSQPTGVA